MELIEAMQLAKETGNFAPVVAQIPYARLLGVQMAQEGSSLLFTLPFSDNNIGNTILPALHGGVIGGFLENAALLHLMWARESTEVPKTIDFSLDFLRPGRARTLFARCDINKQGKRIANVMMTAWQEDAAKPVAVARAHFLLTQGAVEPEAST